MYDWIGVNSHRYLWEDRLLVGVEPTPDAEKVAHLANEHHELDLTAGRHPGVWTFDTYPLVR